MADFDAQLPVRALAINFTTEVANSAGTTINPAEDWGQGSTTSGQNGVLDQGATTTAAPTYVTGTTNPLSLDTLGNLRVLTTPGTGTLQNVNVTEWASVVLGSPTNYGTPPSGEVIGVNAFVTNFPADADAYAQGSTTSGQLGNLTMGATTTAAPTYSTATTNPISIDTTGNLRVVDSNNVNVKPAVLTYFTDVAVASNATVTHSLAGPVSLDAVHSAGSGEIKMTVAIGITGSEVVYWNGFTLAATNCEFTLKNTYVIPAGSSAKVTLTNRDKAAQDLYLTFVSH
jgi:hypothetical protein